VTEIMDGWRERGGPALVEYRAGSSGPEVAGRLLGTADKRWRRL